MEQAFQKYADGATMTDLRDVVQPNAIPALVSGELVGARPLHLATQDRSVTQTPHWGFHCSASLHKRELLRTRHFQQLARKNKENFSKKREGWTVPALLTRLD